MMLRKKSMNDTWVSNDDNADGGWADSVGDIDNDEREADKNR